jgi:very-short-patch-repair endonuclease
MSACPPLRRAKAKQRAKELRRDLTPAERMLWSLVRANRLAGLNFRRQHPIGPYIADFYCHETQLVVEIDGESHEATIERDVNRTAFLQQYGISVFRVSNEDVLTNLEVVGASILRAAGIDPRLWLDGHCGRNSQHAENEEQSSPSLLKRSPPLPNPLPRSGGEGTKRNALSGELS